MALRGVERRRSLAWCMGSVGRRRPLSRRRILEAAIKLADREGLEALSMRRLGRELGVEAMSLYNHVPNKEALLNGMVRILLERLEIPLDGSGGWEERVREAFRSYRQLAREHPNVFPLFAMRPLSTVESLRIIELLRSAGFGTVPALHAFRALSSFTIGYSLAEIQGFALEPKSDRPGTREDESRRLEAPTFEEADRDAEFEFGLDLILTGLQQYITRR
ncbi:MAG: TetR/AcrR family transcriptional regulator C-terminal domain-containing protein [Actinomycetota bacterium]|nr:TetR/AcrR family transcriptional regulator C-terminal domain-containing protein [Actinomycetota bacterium]